MKTIKEILEENVSQQRIYEKIIKKQPFPQKWILVPITLILLCSITLYSLEEEKKGFIKENTNDLEQSEKEEFSNSNSSSQENKTYDFTAAEKKLQLPFKETALPKDLKLITHKLIYEKEKCIGYQKIYASNFLMRTWTITFYENQKIEEENCNLTINNQKYLTVKNGKQTIIYYNYEGGLVVIWTINSSEKEIQDFLEAI